MVAASDTSKKRPILLIGSLVIYFSVWSVLHGDLGTATAFIVLLPVAISAWYFGAVRGMIAAIAGLLCNTGFLLLYKAPEAYLTDPIRMVLAATLVIGAGVIGRLSELCRQLRVQESNVKATAELLAESQERFRLLADLSPYPISILDARGQYIYLNNKFIETFGYTLKDIPTGNEWFLKAYPKTEYREQAKNIWIADLKNTATHEVRPKEFTVTCKDGTVRDVMFKPISMEDGKQFIVYEDITERKEAEERLQLSTLYDALTGLANRELLKSHLRHSISRAQRDKKHQYALLLLDLDGFKYVNESYGLEVGDELLVSTAQRLAALIRPTDTVARLGADDFAILLDDINNAIEATIVAERILTDFRNPFNIGGNELQASVSIGIVPSSKGYGGSEEVLRDGDIALFRAKASGKSRYEIFDVEMRENIKKRITMESDLRLALKRQDFAVHYQPIWSLESSEPVGFEALIRWVRERIVSPGEFIPLAEETGLIVPIDHWLINQVCHQACGWQKQFHNLNDFQFNLNLSSRDFSSKPDLVEVVETVLQASDLNPGCLRFEITESAIMRDIDAVVGIVTKLRDMGIGIDLDDFGTGYSSLSYLHQFPVDGLKIDRSFTASMTEDKKSLRIVKSIITIAHDLGLEVISEGVETTEQLNILKELGCDNVQGFLFSKPLDDQATEQFIFDFSSKAAASGGP
jgi:diguanylate cyclase (GGDEF)-like protein/PAS domain S-box-containing protein